VPSDERWIHEIKFDGYRVQVHLRDAVDWTYRFRKIAADAWRVNAGSAIIDGEVVVQATDGTTEFSLRVERSPLI
jgi:bifunctional non-homologous end joining protein LigD